MEIREGPQTTASSSSEAARLLALPRPTLLLRAPPPKEKELNRGRREREERWCVVGRCTKRRSSECAKLKRERNRDWEEIGEPPSSPSSHVTTTVSLPQNAVFIIYCCYHIHIVTLSPIWLFGLGRQSLAQKLTIFTPNWSDAALYLLLILTILPDPKELKKVTEC